MVTGRITIQLKRRIGAIYVEHTQRSTYFTISKQLKTQEPTLLTSQLHKTSKAKNTYITVSRNSVKAFLMTNLMGYTFIAHNSKGYDCHFILKWLIDQGIKPYCIYNGAKIMFMEIPKLSIRFIDSLNFLQMPLKSFPKTFGMDELTKGYFPHYFNKECNKN